MKRLIMSKLCYPTNSRRGVTQLQVEDGSGGQNSTDNGALAQTLARLRAREGLLRYSSYFELILCIVHGEVSGDGQPRCEEAHHRNVRCTH